MDEIPQYKHGIVTYGANMVNDATTQIVYGGWHKICHAIPSWLLFNNTTFMFSGQTNFKIFILKHGIGIMVPLWQEVLHKVPTTAGRKSATPFCHGHYLTTLHSFPLLTSNKLKNLF